MNYLIVYNFVNIYHYCINIFIIVNGDKLIIRFYYMQSSNIN
jgi:hypothetical protein